MEPYGTRMKFMKLTLGFLLMLMPFTMSAQFYLAGDDSASLKWNELSSQTYRVIYPKGLDSLARVYATELEKWKLPVGRTLGYTAGEYTRGKIPVVLHTQYGISNASVAWAPKRMDVYTRPEVYTPTPIPWAKELAIHEQRHVTQMQFGLSYVQRPFGWFFGEMWNGLTAGLYGGKVILEGDAVIAETALTSSGRGRTADFLNYYMTAFDQGDWRNWPRWRYGSQRWFVPDHYALGYMTIAGIRCNYDCPDFTGLFFQNAAKRPLKAWLSVVSKQVSGGKKMREAFMDSARLFYDQWSENAAARAPYMPVDTVVTLPKRYTQYSDLIMMDDGLYAVKESLVRTRGLVLLDSLAVEKRLRPFANYVGMLYHSPQRDKIYWSEEITNARWALKSRSVIREMDVKTLRVRNLTKKGSFYNPNPSPSEGHIAATEITDDGRSHLVILSVSNGEVETRFDVPDSLQLLESAWLDDQIFATALSDAGYGIYHLHVDALHEHDSSSSDDSAHPWDKDAAQYEWDVTLAPSPVVIKNFGIVAEDAAPGVGHGKGLMFTSDRSGSNELYQLYPESGEVYQISSTRYGAADYQYSLDGKWLYYSAEEHDGKLVARTPTDSLPVKKVDFSRRYAWKIADRLSEQERALGAEASEDDAGLTEPKRYRKFPHLMNIHSWAPVYFNVDRIMNFSYDHVYDLASVGVAAISQNHLGTAVCNFGYSAHPDPDGGKWRNTGHVKFTYTGWYPVIEATVDFNDRRAHNTYLKGITTDGKAGGLYPKSTISTKPYVSGSLSLYIPWSLSAGGWYAGFIPKLSYRISNDQYTSQVPWYLRGDDGSKVEEIIGISEGKQFFDHSIFASIRGYAMHGTAPSGIYPHFGLGFEIGGSAKLTQGTFKLNRGTVPLFGSAMYAYAYCYLPGFVPQQGWRITAKMHREIQEGLFATTSIDPTPRGFTNSGGLLSELISSNRTIYSVTADYGIPVYISDLSLFNALLYIKRMVLTPHADFTFINEGLLFSAGMDVNFDFSSIIWLHAPISIGVRYDYNGGSAFNVLAERGIKMGHHFVGPLFTVDF